MAIFPVAPSQVFPEAVRAEWHWFSEGPEHAVFEFFAAAVAGQAFQRDHCLTFLYAVQIRSTIPPAKRIPPRNPHSKINQGGAMFSRHQVMKLSAISAAAEKPSQSVSFTASPRSSVS